MSEFVVHGVPGSPYLRIVLLGTEEKRASYRLAAMAMGENKTPAYLARQPFARIPMLEHGDFQLYETQAILRYLDAVLTGTVAAAGRAQGAGAPGSDHRHRRLVRHAVHHCRDLGRAAHAPALLGPDTDDEKVAAALPDARVCVRELERLKARAPYLAGERLSIADLMLAPHLDYFAATPEGRDLGRRRASAGWLEEAMRSRDSFQATTMERLKAAA